MEFGEVPVTESVGGVLAHSLAVDGLRLKKGVVLRDKDVDALLRAGVETVTIARLDPDDMPEDAAASALGRAFAGPNLRLTEPVSGRVNVIATAPGILRVAAGAVAAFNAVDEAITVATLPDFARVQDGTLVATIKVIPYAAAAADVARAVAAVVPGEALVMHPFAAGEAALILTRTPGLKDSLLTKGEAVIRDRLTALRISLGAVHVVDHTFEAVAEALARDPGKMRLILGGSATSDRRDVAPMAVQRAGGTITRFGMPVDPGNLLFLGALGDDPVVGLPGCARAPALNGADWVLERLAAGLAVTGADIAAMGVGGLLKEVPARGLARRARKGPGGQLHVVLLAAGRSSRMKGDHKLLRMVDGVPLVRRTADRLSVAGLPVHVVTDPRTPDVARALDGAPVEVVEAPDAALGLSASLRTGLAALPADATGVIVALADMPDVDAHHIRALAAAHDPAAGALIVVPQAPNGKRGNPILFDRRYFELLGGLTGDRGAKALVAAESDAVATVSLDAGVLIDLDTPEAWAAWEAARKTG